MVERSAQQELDAIELQEAGRSQSERPPRNEVAEEPPLSKAILLKLASASFTFFVAGVNDGSLGALVPYLIRSYEVETNLISVLFATTFTGWFCAAISNSHLCQYLDLGAMLLFGALLQTIAHALRCWLPPFALFIVTFWLVSLGQAFQDSHANSFVATVKAAHRWLGFIHAMYMGGCLVGPFVATGVASANTPSRWNLFYTFPLGLGVVNVILVAVAFWDTIALRKNPSHVGSDAEAHSTSEHDSRNKGAMKVIKGTLRLPSVWLLSLFYFFYLGASITAGGWVVEYLVAVRNGALSKMGYVSAGFSGGGFLGRLLLTEPTTRLGERRMLLVYSVVCLGLQLLFWLVPNIIAASVAVSLLGFFLGPFFATGVSVGSKLFPPELCSSALALVFVLGQVGGSIFPAVTGIIAAHAGVKVLQPMLVGLIVAMGISWLLVPKPPALHQE
ncbi:hypothetical protein VTO42DRAFT_5779 [Malbranchea cinnamomea]